MAAHTSFCKKPQGSPLQSHGFSLSKKQNRQSEKIIRSRNIWRKEKSMQEFRHQNCHTYRQKHQQSILSFETSCGSSSSPGSSFSLKFSIEFTHFHKAMITSFHALSRYQYTMSAGEKQADIYRTIDYNHSFRNRRQMSCFPPYLFPALSRTLLIFFALC